MPGVKGRVAAKRDANEPEIVQALQMAGALVYRIDKPCDLIVLCDSQVYLAEVKQVKIGRFTPDEVVAIQEAADKGVIIHILKTPEDALRMIGRFAFQDGWE